MVENSLIHLFANVRENVKHRFWNVITGEDDQLSGGKRIDAAMGMSRTANSGWTLPTVKRTPISVEERVFLMRVTNAFGSVHDCCIGQAIDVDHIVLLGKPTERCKTYEGIKRAD